MRRVLPALLSAVDALAIVAIGLAVALVPATILWGVQFGFAIDFVGFYQFSANVWLLGHGVDVTVMLDQVFAASLGLGSAHTPLRISIALLGIGLLTVQLSVRAGRRAAISDNPQLSFLSAVLTTAAVSTLIVCTAGSPVALPSRPQGILFPTAIVAVAMFVAILRTQAAAGWHSWLAWLSERVRWSRLDVVLRRDIVASALAGAIIVAGILTLAAITLAVMIATNYAAVVGMYQSLQGGVLGGGVVTIAELVVLPNLVVWAASWLVGAGFAIGSGTAISPAGTLLGPIPGFPVVAAVPSVTDQWGFVVVLIPVLFAFFVAMLIRQRHDRYSSPARAKVVGGLAAGIAAVAALLLGLLAWWSGGAIGPGRMAEVGPNPLLVSGWTFVLVFVGACVGGAAGRLTANK